MYQFTTQTVLNDLTGVTVANNRLVVPGVGTFKKDKIVSIYKAPYKAAVKEVAKVTVPTLTSGAAVRLELDIRLSQNANSEYAHYFIHFGKPVVLEIIATGTAATDAGLFVTALTNWKNRYGHSYVTATASGADITLTATDPYQRIHSVKVLQEGASNNTLIQPIFTDVTAGTFAVTTPGFNGFGDDAYMIRSVQVPTIDNKRAFGLNEKERPVLGGNYTQYTLRYKTDEEATDGIVYGFDSVTTHVFFVKASLVSTMETELDKLSLTGGYKLSATIATTGITAVAHAVGPVTYKSSNTAVATIATDGTATKVANGDVVLSVTDSVGNTVSEEVTYV